MKIWLKIKLDYGVVGCGFDPVGNRRRWRVAGAFSSLGSRVVSGEQVLTNEICCRCGRRCVKEVRSVTFTVASWRFDGYKEDVEPAMNPFIRAALISIIIARRRLHFLSCRDLIASHLVLLARQKLILAFFFFFFCARLFH